MDKRSTILIWTIVALNQLKACIMFENIIPNNVMIRIEIKMCLGTHTNFKNASLLTHTCVVVCNPQKCMFQDGRIKQ